MTTTIRVTKTETQEFSVSVFLDILADGTIVGSATLIRYYGEGGGRKYTHLERIDIDEEFRDKGFGTAAIKTMCGNYGRIVAAPDSEDSKRLYERIGNLVVDTTGHMDEVYLCVGFGVYEFY